MLPPHVAYTRAITDSTCTGSRGSAGIRKRRKDPKRVKLTLNPPLKPQVLTLGQPRRPVKLRLNPPRRTNAASDRKDVVKVD